MAQSQRRGRGSNFEQFGHRGLWDYGWKITTYHQPGQPFDDDEWGLFHVDEDFSECHDLAAENLERLREMIDAWWVEAGEHGILPLDDRLIELFLLPSRPGTPHARDDYVYYPPMSHLPMDAAPRLGMSSWDITADVTIPPGGAEGVIYARGSHNTGHSFFLAADGELHFDYNALGDHHRAHAPLSLPPGRATPSPPTSMPPRRAEPSRSAPMATTSHLSRSPDHADRGVDRPRHWA